SCRVAAPHVPPYSLRKDEHPEGREVDALVAVAQRMAESDPDDWPHALLLLGDQVYADEVSPEVEKFIRSRRDPEVPPGDTIADSRAGRVLQPGVRNMIDPREMRWIEDHATGGFDHLVLATSMPLFLTPALHDLEAWNEAVCDGAWGRTWSWLGEKIRQVADL